MKLFNSIQVKRPKKSKFDLTHERKFSLEMGKLVPIMCTSVVPGDRFRVNTESLVRFAPLLAPMMHRVNVTTHWFYVPNRILWNEWEDFITGGVDGDLAPVPPRTEITEASKSYFVTGSLADYLGIPVTDGQTVAAPGVSLNSLPFRAYAQIYNDYFVDQNVGTKIDFPKTSGPLDDISLIGNLKTRAWEKDYFTSALPWAQRGPEVLMPFEGQVQYRDNALFFDPLSTTEPSGQYTAQPTGAADGKSHVTASANAGAALGIDNIESVSGTGTTITDLRRAARLQEWYEKNATGGARYIEQILAHFGEWVPDARLQRAEFLGGSTQPVSVSEVLSNFQFSGDAEGLPQGNMAGHAISVGGRNGFSRKFQEHGWVIGIMSVLPRTAYQNGLPKDFSRFDKFDYLWPEFAQIGEQEIKNAELYVDWTNPTNNDGTFGYNSRYSEYKYIPSTVHGQFKSSLSYWHMGRIFSSAPVLNESFVTADPTKRIFAVETEPQHLYVQVLNKVDAVRPLPYFGTPRL